VLVPNMLSSRHKIRRDYFCEDLPNPISGNNEGLLWWKRKLFTEDDIWNLNVFRINILSRKPLFRSIFCWKIINSDFEMFETVNIKSSSDGR
jgi:hypothetical protein